MAKKKNKHNFWKRVHFKYRLSVMNENTLEELWKIKASIFSGIVLLLIFASLLIAVTSAIIIATPIRYYLPGYLDAEVREQAIRSAIKTDSLRKNLENQEVYIHNLHDVFTGKIQNIDSVKMVDTISISENDPLLQKSKAEREFVQRYEEEEKYNLSVLPTSITGATESLVFFKPLKGLVVNKYNPLNDQYGITIKVANKETVSAVMEGSVMFSGYDINTGYTIQVQHKNGYVSVYRNNTSLLKKTGDKIRTGEAIAIIGNDKDKDVEMFAQFELWNKGSSVNPEDYILFK